MANSTVSFILGVLTVIIVIAGVYLYMDFSKSNTTVANYSANNLGGETYIYDENEIIENTLDDSIADDINDDAIPTRSGFVTGKLCYPSHMLPAGEIVAKNIITGVLTENEYDGSTTEYKIQLDPGKYNIRYQAHLSGEEDNFTSGYYTKCGINSTNDVCNASDGHALIPVEITAGSVVTGIDLCDFYYTEEPEF